MNQSINQSISQSINQPIIPAIHLSALTGLVHQLMCLDWNKACNIPQPQESLQSMPKGIPSYLPHSGLPPPLVWPDLGLYLSACHTASGHDIM